MSRLSAVRPLLPLVIAVVFAGCREVRPAGPPLRLLDPGLDWFGDVRARVDALLERHGRTSRDYLPAAPPLAVFEWDHGVIHGDVGAQTLYFMLAHDKIRQPPERDFRATSPYLTEAAALALEAACAGLAAPGEPLATASPAGAACALEIVRIHDEGKTSFGKDAFAGWNHRRVEPAAAWAAALQAGYAPDEIGGFADLAIDEGLARSLGATWSLGGRDGPTAALRIYDQMRDLIAAAAADGFDVWIVSASAQPAVERFAARLGVSPGHVIGARTRVGDDGKLTPRLADCGPATGASEASATLPYRDGARCLLNQIVLGDTSSSAMRPYPDERRRPLLAVGATDGAATFLADTTGLKLVLDLHRSELLCSAYGNLNDAWRVLPLPLAPLAPLATGYPCSTSGCRDEAGGAAPCRDERGQVIPDQADRVSRGARP